MFQKHMRLSLHLAAGALIVAGGLLALPAQAANVGKEWDRGCADAKGGSYDRSSHSDAYESGWNACKQQQKQASSSQHSKAWQRGCSDAKGGSYDRSKHSDDYEAGWQACKRD